MRDVIITVLYMVSAVLFIRGIKLLGKADTARKGNGLSAVGMLIAVITVLFEKQVMDAGVKSYLMIAGAVILGSIIGAVWAKKVEMTGMPQLVALFNGFGGLSSLLVALAQYANYRTLGADAVGMSSACEGIAARHMGLETVGISCISNMACGVTDKPLSHEEVKETANRVAPMFRRLLRQTVKDIHDNI